LRFYADLHVHSKYSRATSRDADLEHLALWARRKGITVVGTGDFTHPAWFDEIRTKLVPAEPGLFRLRPEIEREVFGRLPLSCEGPVRFLLEVEISTIYKKGDRTRKVHHLIYAASLDTAANLRRRLGEIGNLNSDGRPILGLDSRHLLEITLESGPDAYLVPAHIWTPWFAALGSKSGFDSIADCYGDLAPQIFAVETGLSSDPPMNWRVSELDRFTLVSNSDAHSPPMLGREASAFDTELDYFAIRRALETGEGFGGTVEFFPEEGKYHLDGHRACGVRLEPPETRRLAGLCPTCGKPLTVGVLHRVEELADRPEGADRARTSPFRCLVPLPEVLSEIHGVGPKSRSVGDAMERLIGRLGPEIDILESLPIEDVGRAAGSLLSEALIRLRAGRVIRDAGYDGEYGTIHLFEPGEIAARSIVAPLFEKGVDRGTGGPRPDRPASTGPAAPRARTEVLPANPDLSRRSVQGTLLDALDPEQRQAAEIAEGPLLIVAGPGTGKTRTLTHRLASLVAERGVPPEELLALTFSRRAAAELEERLAALLSGAAGGIRVATFHGLGLQLVRERAADLGLPPEPRVADAVERLATAVELFGVPEKEAARLLAEIDAERRELQRGSNSASPSEPSDRAAAFEAALARRGLLDFDSLLSWPVALFDRRPELAEEYRRRYRHVSIDEYQDIDALQYALVRHLVPPGGNLCAIGDPDQSIYGFRGAEVSFFLRFGEDFPGTRRVLLPRNYRSTSAIVDLATAAIRPQSLVPGRALAAVDRGACERVVVREAASERAEAEQVAETLEQLLGGTSAYAFDSGRVGPGRRPELSFADLAVLYRTDAQAAPLMEAFGRAGIPFQKRSHRPLGEQAGAGALRRRLEEWRSLGTDLTAPASVESLLDRAARELGQPGAAELLRPLAARCGDDLGIFLAVLAEGTEVDAWDPRAERVSLLTLHAAKGLEWPVVFLVGCEDGLLPLSWGGTGGDTAEERRLFFVGLTRARSRLFLSYSRRRSAGAEGGEARPSPFLAGLPESLLERGRPEARVARPVQLRLL
jgi:DNA helicase-2/ATP-dependent DNA helicase PcrA